MVYLQTVEWIGPLDHPTARSDYYGREILVTSEPGLTNMSGEPRITGWLGTTNNWHRSAHGEYETVAAALAAAETLFGPLYEPFGEAEDNREALAVRYDRERAAEHVYAADLLHDTRDELIARLQSGCEAAALAAELEDEASRDVDQDCPAGRELYGTEDYLKWLRSLLQGAAHTFDLGGTMAPKQEDVMTNEEAFAYDREMLTRDWEAVLGPRETCSLIEPKEEQ